MGWVAGRMRVVSNFAIIGCCDGPRWGWRGGQLKRLILAQG
jgi:hypothetical protein